MGCVEGKHTKKRVSVLLYIVLYSCCILLLNCGLSTNDTFASTTVGGVHTFSSWQSIRPVDRPIPSIGCGKESVLRVGGSSVVQVSVNPAMARGSALRTYRVYVPESYQPQRSLPVVLVFHQYGDDTVAIERMTAFSQLAEEQGFIAVYPQGLFDGSSNNTFWASLGPIDYGIDDVLFVSNVLDDIQQRLCVDAQRIYATGFSNGGGMVNMLACRLSGRIAAFAPVSGNFHMMPGGCRPSRPVPLLEMHGTADEQLPYTGVDASKDPAWPLPAIPHWLQEWVQHNKCAVESTTILQTPAVTALRWSSCQDNVSVEHYRIEGGKHVWPELIEGRRATEIIWEFFQSYPLPMDDSIGRSYRVYGQAS